MTAVEAEALQAVVQARGQAEAVAQEARTQAEILSVRFAAEIQAAQVREQCLLEQLESLKQELARRTPVEEPRGPPEEPQTTSLESPSPSPNGADTHSHRDVLLRLAHLEKEFAMRLGHLEGEHQALRDVAQDLWSAQETWNPWPGYETPRANSACQEPQPEVHRIDTATDEDEPKATAAPAAEGSVLGSVFSGREGDLESQHVKQKDLHHLKFPSLPDNAGAFRQWRNSVIPMIAAYDRSPEGTVSEWVLQALRARADDEVSDLRVSSGNYPRLDRVIASALTRPEHLKSPFGLKFQAYIEECETVGRPLRGRSLLNFVAREFDPDSTYAAPEGSMQSLRAWRDKARFILSQLPTAERPADKLLSKWIFERLKKVGLMRRHIDKVRDAPEGAAERSFEWLWSRLERCILEGQQEQNMLSIQESLRKGPRRDVPATPAPSDHRPGKGKEAGKGNREKGKGSGSGNPGKGGRGDTAPKKPEAKAGKDKGKGKKGNEALFEKAKEAGVCVFFQRDKCQRDNCPFKHEKLPVAGAPAPASQGQAKAKAASAKATPKSAAVALVVAAMATSVSATTQGTHCTLDVIADTGAGEHLGSREAFCSQGVEERVLEQFCGTSSSHIAFETGGGKKHSNESIGLWSDSLRQVANMFMLKSCPLVYSIGQFVMNQGYSFMWPAGELPCLIPSQVEYEFRVDKDACRYADRLDHCVPIFKEHIELVPGMPAGPLVPTKAPEHIRKCSTKVGWQTCREGRVLVQRKGSKFVKPADATLELRSTWLFSAKDQWFELENKVKWKDLKNPTSDLPFPAEILVSQFDKPEPPAGAARHGGAEDAGRGELARRADPEPAEPRPPAGGDLEAPPESPVAEAEDEEDWVEELEANHFLTHIPKSRKCDVCLRAKLSRAHHRRRENQRESLREARAIEEPEGPGERIAVDHMFSYDQPGEDEEVVSFVIRDRFSGMVWTYPARARDSEEVENALRHFCGRKSPIVSVASDCAPEILKAVRDLGFNSEPSAPNDPIHNPFAESAIRTVKQGTRTLLLQSGLGESFWGHAQRCFAFHCNATLAPPKAILDLVKEKGLVIASTRYEAHLKYPFEGFLIPFGALVWYKDKDARTFAPRGEPSLYLGPVVVDGLRHQGVHLVAPLRSVKEGDFTAVSTKDLAVPNGRWSFPLAKARVLDEENPHHRLPAAESFVAPPELAAPAAEAEGGIADEAPRAESPVVAAPKRNRAITTLRIAVHGKSPKCDGCRHGTYNRTAACRKRFNDLLDFHEPLSRADTAHVAEEEMLEEEYRPPPEDEPPAFIGSEEPGGSEPAMSSSGLAACVDLLLDESMHDGFLPEADAQQVFSSLPTTSVFALSAKLKREKEKTAAGTCFVEFCCSSESNLKHAAQKFGIEYLGLSKDFVDLTLEEHVAQVELWMSEREASGIVIHLLGSLPCTAWTAWQHLNLHKGGPEFAELLRKAREQSLVLVKHFVRLARVAASSGGSVTFEWPRSCSGWKQKEVLQMVTEFDMKFSFPTGCGFRLVIDGKRPLKQWRVASTHARLVQELNKRGCRCEGPKNHDRLEGDLAYKSGFYNKAMANVILGAIFPREVHGHVPACPVVPVSPEPEPHNPRIVPVSEELSHVIESFGLVTKTLTRREMLSSPKALEAVAKEGAKFRNREVWDDATAIDPEELCREAKRNGEKLHLAEAMSIAGIKNSEMPENQQTHKGRIVYRGDITKDEQGAPALFRELHSLPTNTQAVNLTIFIGMIHGFVVQAADACQAFLQAPLRSPIPTWVIIPTELWLPQWKGKFRRVAVKLKKGHPEAPADWQAHLEQVLTVVLGASVVDGFPSVFWHATLAVLITVYVDDILAAGKPKALEEFWRQLSEHIEIEPPAGLDRFLGRYHLFQDTRNVFMHMGDYAKQAVELYLSLPGSKALKPADSPFVADGTLVQEDWEVRGALADSSAKILMKLLWYARLCRPDLSYAISTLASQATTWSKNSDKMAYRLMCYVSTTLTRGLHGVVKDSLEDCSLELYVDADLAGCPLTAKSTSGLWLQITGPKRTRFPIAWSSKRQSTVSRSTTEAELVSMADGLFVEALPVQDLLSRVLGRCVPLTVHEDNEAVLKVVEAGYSVKLRGLVRTQKLSIASISDFVKKHKDEITLKYTNTKEQLADLFTKALGRLPFKELAARLGLSKVPA